MSVNNEFEVVDLIINSNLETRGVDAFALAVIKSERQLRKLFTHLVFQFPCFDQSHVSELRDTLAENKRIYFKEIEKCINSIFICSIEKMVGDDYKHLRARMEESIEFRNKIFHGQLTQRRLTREDLFDLVRDIRRWSEVLARGAGCHIGYDGFARNSFQKSTNKQLASQFIVNFNGIADYRNFLAQNMR